VSTSIPALWQHPHAPSWFLNAVAAPTRSHFVEIRGARIHYLSWNESELEKPGLVLVHGLRAHARWWSFIAPFLLERFRVYALDFAGMGDSEARESYDPLGLALEIAGVIEHAGIAPAVVVGHSLGGGRTLRLCSERPELVQQAVIVDSFVHFRDLSPHLPRITAGPRKVYATFAEAKARYRLTPADDSVLDYVLDYIAHHSLEETPGGFRWKFADNLTNFVLLEQDSGEQLSRIEVPLTYMHGEYSHLMMNGLPERIVKSMRGARGPIAIPEARHHVPLGQPLALVSALRAALY
jgi:pimeloyl-ACP methyl ester carboxylesterase